MKVIDSLMAFRSRNRLLLKLLGECSQAALFAGLLAVTLLTAHWDGLWVRVVVPLYALCLLGTCRGAVLAWRAWRSGRPASSVPAG